MLKQEIVKHDGKGSKEFRSNSYINIWDKEAKRDEKAEWLKELSYLINRRDLIMRRH